MPIKYESIVPWGRSYEEYVGMFNLTDSDLDKSILGCGDGPANFNCIMDRKGKKIISIDPIYQFTSNEIKKRIDATFDNVMEQTGKHLNKFIWTKIKNLEELGKIRMNAMKDFLGDFETGKAERRYIHAELPSLPFDSNKFDIALSSHFLFLYSDNLSLDFHIQSINEMLRVAGEVRIFPILDLNAKKSDYVKDITSKFGSMCCKVEEVSVNYEFQIGGNKMLKIGKII